ncbi:MAG: hypothetical protein JST48_01935 [Bacteroidetes bacterium]|nr:hypothetical protein [Bacteroidota bacterium]
MTIRTAIFKFRIIEKPALHWVALLCIYFLNTSLAFSQQIKVNARFNADSVMIGQPIELSLSVRYPSKLTILFPDSSYSFKPFEFQRKKIYTTQSRDGISLDSVTYRLATYEIDSLQRLRLPIFIVNPSDCTQVFSNFDSVHFKNVVAAIPDSLSADRLPLKVKVDYLKVPREFNYLLAGISIGILAVVLLIVWIVFGKRIKKYFRLKKLLKGYEAFRLSFENSLDKLNQNFSTQQAEHTLVIWKKYLETMVSKPYTKYTSKEIRALENNDELGRALASIDRMIYGHDHRNVLPPFDTLKEYGRTQFEKKKTEVAHG